MAIKSVVARLRETATKPVFKPGQEVLWERRPGEAVWGLIDEVNGKTAVLVLKDGEEVEAPVGSLAPYSKAKR